MLSQRLTARFEVVSLNDPSLLVFSADELYKYGISRDIKVLDLSKCEEPVTRFECIPLTAKWQHLIDSDQGQDSDTAWAIFRNHVKRAINFRNEANEDILELTDDKVDEKCREKLTVDIVSEIAAVIVQKANQVSKGFIMPPTFSAQQARSRVLRAMGVGGKTAKPEIGIESQITPPSTP
jgi:hypothetical protein